MPARPFWPSHPPVRSTIAALAAAVVMLATMAPAEAQDPRRAPRAGAPSAAITFTRDDTGSVEATEPFEAPGQTPIVGDFLGDSTDEGKLDDILWYTPGAGGDSLWRTRKDRVFVGKDVSIGGTFIPIVGWFGNDQDKQDILWYAPGSTTDWIWDFNAGGSITQTSVAINGTYTPVVGRFSNDAGTDILWYAPGAAGDAWWDYNGAGGLTKRSLSVSGSYRPVVGAFAGDQSTGDGVDDVLWYAPGSAPDSLWDFDGDGGPITKMSLAINGTYTPVPGDFSADGYHDVLWYAPGAATDSRWDFTGPGGARSTIPQQINGTYTPLVAELFEQPDRRDDILWFGVGSRFDMIWDFSNSGTPATVSLALTGSLTPALGAFENVPYELPGDGGIAQGRGADILDRQG